MRRHTHDRAGAVIHEDVVRDPDRNFFAVVWVNSVATSVDAVFFNLADIAHFAGPSLLGNQLIDFGPQFGLVRRQIRHQRVLGRKLHGSSSENRVDPRGEHTNA